MMTYIRNLLISIDQLGNVIAGGNPDNTISARVGFYNHYYPNEQKVTTFWKIFEWIIDTTFWLIDGPHHCHEAYHNDAGEFFDTGTRDWAVVILFVIITVSCIAIAALLYLLYMFKIISPKNINRTQNIEERLIVIHSKLQATINELQEYPIARNEALVADAQLNIDSARDILVFLNNLPSEGQNKE